MKFTFFYLFITLFSYLNASMHIGSVELFKGNVKVKRENSIKKERVTFGFELQSGDLVVSAKNSTAKIHLDDGSILILDEKSSVHFSSLINVEQKSGKILYKITSRDARNSLEVKTPFAIIGIKGTTFIVNSDDSNEYISLKEGLIGVASLQEEFALYRQKVQEEFDTYRAKTNSEFEKFKNAQNEYAKVEYTKVFDLKAGHRISFHKQKVEEKSIIDEFEKEFDDFESLFDDIE